MATNDDILDREISHAIHLQRLSKGMAGRMVAILDKTEAKVLGTLGERLERLDKRGFDTGPETTKRLEALIVQLQRARAEIWDSVGKELRTEIEEFAEYERDFQLRILDEEIPAKVRLLTPSMQTIRTAALARPFQGRILKEWLKDIAADDQRRIRDAIRIGFTEGDTTPNIVRRLRGMSINNFQDGVFGKSKRHIETTVRTALNHTANAARNAVGQSNADIIKGVRWVSTLDGRTSPICRGRDGKVYAVDKGPRPPAHPNCRSTTTFITKSFRELGLDIDELPPSSRASMDGQVPSDLTYSAWLRKQPREFVNEVLGKTKAGIFLDNPKLTLDKFVDRSGREYTIAELRAREAAPVKRAA